MTVVMQPLKSIFEITYIENKVENDCSPSSQEVTERLLVCWGQREVIDTLY